MRIIDFDPEFTCDVGRQFPVALVERARRHGNCCNGEFVGVASCEAVPGDWRGIVFFVLTCAPCGQEIGRGIAWRTPLSDSAWSNAAYPWQEGYWQTRRVA